MTRTVPRPLAGGITLAAAVALAVLVLVLTGHGGIAAEAAWRSLFQLLRLA